MSRPGTPLRRLLRTVSAAAACTLLAGCALWSTRLGGRLELDVAQAILMAIENNQALKVERLNPDITRTSEGEQRAVFDPVLGAEASTSVTRSRSRGADGRLHNATGERTFLDAWIDIDVAMVLGTGFPDFRGGVLKYARDLGLNAVRAQLEDLAERVGPRFAACGLVRG